MYSTANADFYSNQVEQAKTDIFNNLKNKRKTFEGGNTGQEIINEYDKYFDVLKNEKVKQVESLENILKHLVKLNVELNIDNSTLNNNLKKINDKISQLNIEIGKIQIETI